MAYGRWQTKIAGVSRICSVPFLVPPRQITSFIHSASTHTLMVEQIRVPFSKYLPQIFEQKLNEDQLRYYDKMMSEEDIETSNANYQKYKKTIEDNGFIDQVVQETKEE
ncbi:MAG: hypothetical protein EZS28_055427 [Streblomastix strix]|uniref:Uncharacterized protein n=1 Tax=Streblomastix strix TaxID=222440 RepID=A0A5J4Q309_9EUKA|nr:MAG: hypothetical protein EZS28_055427 [Streblomastix strix]